MAAQSLEVEVEPASLAEMVQAGTEALTLIEEAKLQNTGKHRLQALMAVAVTPHFLKKASAPKMCSVLGHMIIGQDIIDTFFVKDFQVKALHQERPPHQTLVCVPHCNVSSRDRASFSMVL